MLDALPCAVDIAAGIAPGEQGGACGRRRRRGPGGGGAGAAGRRRGRRPPTTSWPRPATRSTRRSPPPASPVRPGTRSTSAAWSSTSSPTPCSSTPSEAVLRPEGRQILDAVAPTPDRAAQRAARSRGTPTTCRSPPAAPGRRTGSCRATARARCSATSPRDGVPEPRMSATGYSSTRPLVPETDPQRHDRQPAGRHRRPVHRLGRGQRPAAGHRRRTPRSDRMSTKEKTADDRRGDGQGRQEEADPDPARRAARGRRRGLLLPVHRRRGRGRGAGGRRASCRSTRSRSTWPAAAT